MEARKLISVRVDTDLHDRLTAIADETGLDLSEVVRNALTAGVLDGERQVARLRSPAVRQLVRALLAIDGDPDQSELFEGILGNIAGTVPAPGTVGA